jgi:hypothetical protein
MPNENFIPGVIDDPRSHEEKLRDYLFFGNRLHQFTTRMD